MLALKRKPGLAMIERRLGKSVFVVTRLAVLLERAAMHVDMACGAGVGARLYAHRALFVAGYARDGGVASEQRKRSSRVIDLCRFPCGGRVACGAARTKRPLVTILVATGARRKREPFVRAVDVATRAGDRRVGARQRKRRFRMIESSACNDVLERYSRRVARGARLSEFPVVDVLMARLARGGSGEKRTRLVARDALPCHCRMPAVEWKSSDGGMVERGLIERSQLSIGAGVLHVTGHAVSLHIAVYACLLRDPIGHGLVTRQTLRSRHSLPTLVALLAVRDSFETGVWLRQLARREQRSELTFGAAVPHQPDCRHQQPQSPHAPYHLNGT